MIPHIGDVCTQCNEVDPLQLRWMAYGDGKNWFTCLKCIDRNMALLKQQLINSGLMKK